MFKFSTKCQRELPFRDFNKNKSHKYGLQNHCRVCCAIDDKQYRSVNREKINAQSKEYYSRHKEDCGLRRKQYYQKNKKQISATNKIYRQTHREYRANREYNMRYGISTLERNQMLEWQDYKCAICRMKENGKKLCIDHCHNTGRIRMLLCTGCNRGVGITDNEILLRAKAEYLSTFSS